MIRDLMPEFMRHIHLLVGEQPHLLIAFRGRLAADGEELRAVYAGSGANREFLSRLVMDEPRGLELKKLRSYFQLPGALAQALAGAAGGGQTELVLTDLPPLWARLTPRQAQWRFPAWVRQELILPPAQARWILPRAVERDAARLARRYAYTVDFSAVDFSAGDFSTWERALRQFFHEQYRPYVQARFAASAIVVTEEEFMRKARGCTLARLHRQGEWVAGMLLERRRPNTLRFGWFGAAGAPAPPGASEVLDSACARYARSTGAEIIQLGHSRPLLTDGVVRYKAKLGAQIRPVRYPQAALAITLLGNRPALLERLDAHQLIAADGHVQTLEAS